MVVLIGPIIMQCNWTWSAASGGSRLRRAVFEGAQQVITGMWDFKDCPSRVVAPLAAAACVYSPGQGDEGGVFRALPRWTSVAVLFVVQHGEVQPQVLSSIRWLPPYKGSP